MYQCNVCGGYADAGELRGGTCIDCIEERRQEEERKDWHRKMLAKSVVEQTDGQLVMRFGAS